MAMHDFQFFDQAKIRSIEEQEHEFSMRRKTQMALIKEAKLKVKKERSDDNDVSMSTDDLESAKLQQELETMYISQELTEEKQRLISQGFPTWQKKDFRIFISALERFGRDQVDEIVNSVVEQTQKDREEVLKYHKVFWERLKDLEGWDKILEKVEKGEQKIKRRGEIEILLQKKVGLHKNPFQTLQIEYGTTKGKVFTEDEDRFLVCQMHRLGFGNWEVIRQEIRKSWLFRFDWFFKSRSAEELKRRCEVLIRMIEKEFEDETGIPPSTGPGKKRKVVSETTSIGGDDGEEGGQVKKKGRGE
jgi:SWI/SNF-related matrix-associated actin-dependent regulator of chromatin subfamily A member 5